MSEARKVTPSSSPSTKGVSRHAATIVSGSSAEITAIEKDPRRRRNTDRVASASDNPPASWSSIRCTITSVSVPDVIVCPPATTSSRSDAWFSMIPLWISATRPVQSTCGCAFSSVGDPCVAQRVCPMAAAWPAGAEAVRSASVATDVLAVAARARQTPPSTTRATPAES